MKDNWRQRAPELLLAVRDRHEHQRRWLNTLHPTTESLFTRLRRQEDADPRMLLARGLDAAAGVGLAAERLQRSALGESWKPQGTAFEAQRRSLELPLAAPAGCEREAWAAMRAVRMLPGEAREWEDVAKVLPDEVDLLDRLQREDPSAYERLADASSAVASEIDLRVRPVVQSRQDQLTDFLAFRKAWQALFGSTRIRPAVGTHLAVHILDVAGMESVRDIALFLDHVGLLHATVAEEGAWNHAASLDLIDTEVSNARQALKRVNNESPDGSLDALLHTIEWVTFADFRRGLLRRGLAPVDP